jgi:predicted acyltransferase
LRGLIIAAMILVNTAGDYRTTYWPLKHAQWNGWTPTDLIFPSFLFMMGVAMTLSFPARIGRGVPVRALVAHVVVRSLALFAIGLFINAFPNFDLATWRIPGVLQRFAICYFVVALLYLATYRQNPIRTNIRLMATAAIICLVSYWVLLTFVPVPGYGAGQLTAQGSLSAYLDRMVFGRHLYGETRLYDPEGVLSTIPSFATVILGLFAGECLRSAAPQKRKTMGLIAAGAALMILGQMLHPFFPINKRLWTSTFVLLAGGFTTLSLGVCYYLFDVLRWRKWTAVALVFGTNSILAYTLSEVIDSVLDETDVHSWFYQHALASWISPYNASLTYSLLYVGLIFLLVLPLYLKRIFVRL